MQSNNQLQELSPLEECIKDFEFMKGRATNELIHCAWDMAISICTAHLKDEKEKQQAGEGRKVEEGYNDETLEYFYKKATAVESKITGRSVIENADPYIDEKLPAKTIQALIVSIESAMKLHAHQSKPVQEEGWVNEKPEFTEECILLTASFFRNRWEYTLWTIERVEGEDLAGNELWYLGLLNEDGEEWGPITDLSAQKYKVLPFLPSQQG